MRGGGLQATAAMPNIWYNICSIAVVVLRGQGLQHGTSVNRPSPQSLATRPLENKAPYNEQLSELLTTPLPSQRCERLVHSSASEVRMQ